MTKRTKIALAVVILLVIAYIIYRKAKKAKQNKRGSDTTGVSAEILYTGASARPPATPTFAITAVEHLN